LFGPAEVDREAACEAGVEMAQYHFLKYFKKKVQYNLERLSGRRAFLSQGARHGVEDVLDIAEWIAPTDVILDVGANDGESAIKFRAAFPSARIISFEPIASTFEDLKKNTRGRGIETHKLALGAATKSETMYVTRFSVTNSLVRPPDDQLVGVEQVDVVTLDDFVRDQKIRNIGLLKIDAEGFDLEVIKGAAKTLASGDVKAILVEVGFQPGEKAHPLFDEIRDFVAQFGYRVFGFYSQRPEWTGEPSLNHANVMFYRAGGQSRESSVELVPLAVEPAA
jgi:FkbM family methyltransferase